MIKEDYTDLSADEINLIYNSFVDSKFNQNNKLQIFKIQDFRINIKFIEQTFRSNFAFYIYQNYNLVKVKILKSGSKLLMQRGKEAFLIL